MITYYSQSISYPWIQPVDHDYLKSLHLTQGNTTFPTTSLEIELLVYQCSGSAWSDSYILARNPCTVPISLLGFYFCFTYFPVLWTACLLKGDVFFLKNNFAYTLQNQKAITLCYYLLLSLNFYPSSFSSCFSLLKNKYWHPLGHLEKALSSSHHVNL